MDASGLVAASGRGWTSCDLWSSLPALPPCTLSVLQGPWQPRFQQGSPPGDWVVAAACPQSRLTTSTSFSATSSRAQPLSSVSSLEVHFDLLDLTELTDMSDQELAEVFADSDDENVAESPGGLQPHALPRAGYLRSPSWTRGKAEQGRDRTRLGDSELQAGEADTFLTVERPQDE
uniref:Dysbindin domain-containing protein 1 n=1 Tax=Crocodylus porosus TaxID=8502 RepID=A0A7M4EKQ8_CROPO